MLTITFRGQTFTINAGEIFGPTSSISGRFKGWACAENGGGRHMDVTLLIDSRGNVFFVGKDGTTYFGGSGPLNLEPGSDDKNDRDKDDDEKHNRDKDSNGLKFHANFSIKTSLDTIKGNINLNPSGLHGFIALGDLKLNVRGFRESANHQLGNISTRAFVNNTPQGQLIAGFIVTGGAKLVLIRALGPSLANQGITEPVLADPVVTLFRRSDGAPVQIAQNNDWQTNANAAVIRATGIPPQNSKEAALVAYLEPGAYTAVVNGADNGIGVALVEVYGISVD